MIENILVTLAEARIDHLNDVIETATNERETIRDGLTDYRGLVNQPLAAAKLKIDRRKTKHKAKMKALKTAGKTAGKMKTGKRKTGKVHWTSTPAGRERMRQIQNDRYAAKRAGTNGHPTELETEVAPQPEETALHD